MLLVNRAHQRSSGRQYLIDEDEDGLFRRELDALANDIDKLTDGEISGNQIFLLVDGSNI